MDRAINVARDERGITPVVAVVLLFGLIAMSASLVVVSGMSLVDTLQDQQEVEQAETEMQVVHSELQAMTSGSDGTPTTIETGRDGVHVGEGANVTLTVGSETAEVELQSLVRETSDGSYVSEGGGLFRDHGETSTIESPPALRIDEGHIDIALLGFDGDLNGTDDEITLRRNADEATDDDAQAVYEELRDRIVRRDDDAELVVTVESEHADAWGQHLQSQHYVDPSSVSVSDDSVTATFDFTDAHESIADIDSAEPEFEASFDTDEYDITDDEKSVAFTYENTDADEPGTGFAALVDENGAYLDLVELEDDTGAGTPHSGESERFHVGNTLDEGDHDVELYVSGPEGIDTDDTPADDATLQVTADAFDEDGDGPESPDFSVEFVEDQYAVSVDGTMTIDAEVTNDGVRSRTVAAFEVEDDIVAVEETGVLDEGESETVSFEYDAAGVDAGSYDLSVSADSDTDLSRLDVKELIDLGEYDAGAEKVDQEMYYYVDSDSELVGEEIEAIEINYPTDSFDVSSPGGGRETVQPGQLDVGIDTTGDGSRDGNLDVARPDAGEVTDRDSTLTAVTEDSETIDAGDGVYLKYKDVDTPTFPGFYETTVTIQSSDGEESLTTELTIGGDIEDEFGTLADREDGQLEVNGQEITVTQVGTEVTEEVVVEEEERMSLDVSFVIDESGSMDYLYYWEFLEDNDHPANYEPVSESMTTDEARDRGVITYEGEDWDGTSWYSTEAGDMPHVQRNGEWIPYTEVYEESSEWLIIAGRGHNLWFADPGEEIRIYSAGFDPNDVRVDATKNFIDALEEDAGDRAGLVDFDDDAREVYELSNDLEAVNGSVKSNAGGSTHITDGIREGQAQLNDRDGERVIVLLGDGEHNQGDPQPEDYVASDEFDDDVAIYTVGLGDAVNDDVFRQIADETGGKYYPAAEADELEDVFDDIAGESIPATRQVQHKSASTGIEYGGSTATITEETSGADPSDFESVADFEDINYGELVSFETSAYECDEQRIVDSAEHEGERYDVTECESGSEELLSNVDHTADTYHLYTDGDSLDVGDDVGWYQDGPESVIEAFEEDTGRTLYEDGQFVLGEHQAVVLAELEGDDGFDYSLLLVETEEAEEPDVPAFEVEITDIDDSVEQGDVLDVQVEVENVGTGAGATQASIGVEDGPVLDGETVELAPDESTTLRLSQNIGRLDPSAYPPGDDDLVRIGAKAGDASDSEVVEVELAETGSGDPEFDIDLVDETIDPEETEIDVELETNGDFDEDVEVVAANAADGDVFDSETASFADEDTDEVTLDVGGLPVGEQYIEISAGGSSEIVEVTVELPDTVGEELIDISVDQVDVSG